jgi:hypothetical protein
MIILNINLTSTMLWSSGVVSCLCRRCSVLQWFLSIHRFPQMDWFYVVGIPQLRWLCMGSSRSPCRKLLRLLPKGW